MNIGDHVRFKNNIQFIDDEGRLTESKTQEVLFGVITDIKKDNLLMVGNILINRNDVIKARKTLEELIEKGDAYFITKGSVFVKPPTFINRDTDYYEFKTIMVYATDAKLTIVARENIPWKEIK